MFICHKNLDTKQYDTSYKQMLKLHKKQTLSCTISFKTIKFNDY